MEKRIIFATGNEGKMKEIRMILADLGVPVLSMKEAGVSADIVEDGKTFDIKNQNLLDRLEGVPDEKRTARIVCAICAALPDGRKLTTRGTIEGIIGHGISGENGFGYDPIFWLPEYGCSTAELSPEKKNELSHRGKALRAIKEQLREILKEA